MHDLLIPLSFAAIAAVAFFYLGMLWERRSHASEIQAQSIQHRTELAAACLSAAKRGAKMGYASAVKTKPATNQLIDANTL